MMTTLPNAAPAAIMATAMIANIPIMTILLPWRPRLGSGPAIWWQDG
jgi:hypothetical protein